MGLEWSPTTSTAIIKKPSPWRFWQVDAYTTAIYIITLKLLDDLMLYSMGDHVGTLLAASIFNSWFYVSKTYFWATSSAKIVNNRYHSHNWMCKHRTSANIPFAYSYDEWVALFKCVWRQASEKDRVIGAERWGRRHHNFGTKLHNSLNKRAFINIKTISSRSTYISPTFARHGIVVGCCHFPIYVK